MLEKTLIASSKAINKMVIKRSFYIIGIIILFYSKSLIAQINNDVFNRSESTLTSDSNKVGFAFNALCYMRNTEYFNKIEQGRTLFGNQFHPTFYYLVNPNIKIEAGLFTRQDFGSENTFTSFVPTFSLKTNYRNLNMVFGTLEGATTHRIIEPMFDIARVIENRIENGFQLKYVNDKTFFDSWINWEKFIERNSNHKEKFTAGINFEKLLNKPTNKLKVWSVNQGMLSHRGGQIDTDSINLLTMQANIALGLKGMYDINNKHQIALDVYYLRYFDLADTSEIPFKNGNAWYGNASYKFNNFQFMLSYFNGNNFIAPRGTSIFQSQSIDNASYFETNRELIFTRFFYNKKLFNHMNLSARFEPVYDIKNAIMDFSYSFYLSYNLNKLLN